MLPTPTTQEPTSQCELTESRRKTKDGKDSHSLNLGRVAAMLPTPTSFDYNSARTPEKYEEDKAKYAEKGVNLQMPLKQMARNGMLPNSNGSRSGQDHGQGESKLGRQRLYAPKLGQLPNSTPHL